MNEHRATDRELVIAALLGHLPAFDELALRYRPAMLAVAETIVGSPQAAEDVVQDALLLAFTTLPELKNFARFGSWLYAITRHRALRYHKTASRTELRENLDRALLAHSRAIVPDPAQVYEQRLEHRELGRAIRSLDPEYRIVLRLYYWDDMPQQRIANFLGLPLSTVKWRLRKARQLLKTQFQKGEIR